MIVSPMRVCSLTWAILRPAWRRAFARASPMLTPRLHSGTALRGPARNADNHGASATIGPPQNRRPQVRQTPPGGLPPSSVPRSSAPPLRPPHPVMSPRRALEAHDPPMWSASRVARRVRCRAGMGDLRAADGTRHEVSQQRAVSDRDLQSANRASRSVIGPGLRKRAFLGNLWGMARPYGGCPRRAPGWWGRAGRRRCVS